MKKIIIAAAMLLVSTPAYAQSMTLAKVQGYIRVCRDLDKMDLDVDGRIAYMNSVWGSQQESLENSAICMAYTVGVLDGVRSARK